ncbi:hypothetical protein F4703DRAFT_1394779 [Phycomyces blakesleeanus]
MDYENMKSESFCKEYGVLLEMEAKFIEKCPVMNLAAVVLKDNSLTLYRINGEIVWSEEFSKDGIVGIAWRPDGQELVVAYHSGKVMRTGIAFPNPTWVSCTFPALISSLKDHAQSRVISDGIISCISWAKYEISSPFVSNYGFDPNAIEVRKHLPALNKIAPDGPITLMPTRKKIELMPDITNTVESNMSLLLIGTRDEKIYLR